jgi:DNA-directed RNA polymerase specialized sigma24 family protein
VKGKGLAEDKTAGRSLLQDPAKFDVFYRRYFLPLVRRATWKHNLQKEDARDVVQEAFILALSKLDPTRNPRAWLIQVVDHLSANFQRKLVRRARLATKWTPQVGGSATVAEVGEEVDSFDSAENYVDGDNY